MSLEKIILMLIALFFQSLAITTIIFKQQEKININKKIIFIIMMWIYCVISFIFIKNQFRFILTIIVISLIMYFILKIKDRKIILYSFNSVMLLSFSEIVVSFLLVAVGINSKLIVNNIYYNLLANVLISFFSILLINISIIKNLILKINKLFNKKRYLINYLCIFLLIIYLIVSKNGLEFILKSNYYINILFMISIVIIIAIIIKNEFKYEGLKEENKQMLNYVSKYEKIITEQGKVNHEFKNQLMVIRGYAQMNSSKLIEYLDSIVKDVNKTYSSYLVSQLNKFPDGGIKGLLYYKLSIMEDEKIKYEINVENGVKTKLKSLNTNMCKNVTKVLGVLLDNAIDACRQTKRKKIIISMTKNKGNVTFNIYNTYVGKIDLSKIGTGYTTKGKGHGYGLRLVNDIINNNDIISLCNEIDGKYYISKLNIRINKK